MSRPVGELGFPLHVEYVDSLASPGYEMFWPERLLSVAILDQFFKLYGFSCISCCCHSRVLRRRAMVLRVIGPHASSEAQVISLLERQLLRAWHMSIVIGVLLLLRGSGDSSEDSSRQSQSDRFTYFAVFDEPLQSRARELQIRIESTGTV